MSWEEPTFFENVAYGVGHSYNDICSNIWLSYFIIYVNKIAGFSSVNSGLLFLVGQVTDAFSTVILANYSECENSSFDRRRRIWHLCGSIVVLFSFPALFNPCFFVIPEYILEGHWSLMVYYMPLVIIFKIGMAVVHKLSIAVNILGIVFLTYHYLFLKEPTFQASILNEINESDESSQTATKSLRCSRVIKGHV
ncbi:hypothetical protein RF11_14010 [Thelohanellus kitauei]|uniref:Uncharacterized protein n=1 Tax=Thelohanellus kitauei TaxID=669202 RepID=A0A0C2IB78_THEKT|nr:hypothetical protein RF11_14010 [Thelohanellus kitauei]